MSENIYWNPRTETMPRHELKKLQVRKLQSLIAWAYKKSSFWRRKLDGVGVKPEDIRDLEDIRKIPFLTRMELNQSQLNNPLVGDIVAIAPDRAVRYHQTSGTSGKTPLRILDSWKDWEWVSEIWCYGMYPFGVRETDIVYLAYGYGTFIGFWGLTMRRKKSALWLFPAGECLVRTALERLLN